MLTAQPGFPEQVVSGRGAITLGYYNPRLKLVRVRNSSPSPEKIVHHELNHHRKQALSVYEMIFRKNFQWTLEFYNNLISPPDLSLKEVKYALMPNGFVEEGYNLLLNEALTDDLITDSLVAMEILDVVENGNFEQLRRKVGENSPKHSLINACQRLHLLLSPRQAALTFERLVALSFSGYPTPLYQRVGHQVANLPGGPNRINIGNLEMYVPEDRDSDSNLSVIRRRAERSLASAETSLGEKFAKEVPDTRLELLVKIALELYGEGYTFKNSEGLCEFVHRVSGLEQKIPTGRTRFEIERAIQEATPALSNEEQKEWSRLFEVLLAPIRDPSDPRTDPRTAAIGFRLTDETHENNFLNLQINEYSFFSRDGPSWPDDIAEETLALRYAEYIQLEILKRQWNQHILSELPIQCATEWIERRLKEFSELKRSIQCQWDEGDWQLVTMGREKIPLSPEEDPFATNFSRTDSRRESLTKIIREHPIEVRKSTRGFIDCKSVEDESITLDGSIDDEMPSDVIYPTTAAALSLYLGGGEYLTFDFDRYLGGVVSRRLQERQSKPNPEWYSLSEMIDELEENRRLERYEDKRSAIDSKSVDVRFSKEAVDDISQSWPSDQKEHIDRLIQLQRDVPKMDFFPVEYSRLNKILYRFKADGGFVFWVTADSTGSQSNIEQITVEAIFEKKAWTKLIESVPAEHSPFEVPLLLYKAGVDTDYFPREPMEKTLKEIGLPRQLREIDGIGEKTAKKLKKIDIHDGVDLVLLFGHYKDRLLAEIILDPLPENHESSVRDYVNQAWDALYRGSSPKYGWDEAERLNV